MIASQNNFVKLFGKKYEFLCVLVSQNHIKMENKVQHKN